MPVYNAEKYLRSSIESILHQTCGDFELLIFDDASTDHSREIIDSYKDDRIHVIRSEVNRGYLFHLNHGLSIARGQYIARMDADDISTSGRFALQTQLLDNNPEIGVCGTWAKLIREENGKDVVVGEVQKPSQHEQILAELYKGSPFFHSSVMLRRDLLQKHALQYEQDYYTAEDYRLWYQLSSLTRLHVIEQPLLLYRLHTANISKVRNEQQTINANRVRVDVLADRFGISLAADEKKVVYTFLSQKKIEPAQQRTLYQFISTILHSAPTPALKQEFRIFFKDRFLWYINNNDFAFKDLNLLKGNFIYKIGTKNLFKYIYKCIF